MGLAAFPVDWTDLQALSISIMEVGGYGLVSLGGASPGLGIDFDESTDHAHGALADMHVTARLLKQAIDGAIT